MRVAVLVRDVAEELPSRVQVRGERLVGLLEEDAADQRQVFLEGAVGADRVDHREAVRTADLEVVGAERGGLVDQTRTVLGRHVLGVDHVVRLGREVDQRERALVAPALHLRPGERLARRLPALAERLLQEGFGDDQLLLAVRRDDVPDPGVRGDRRVGDQRPGGGRPDQERRLAGQRAAGEGEADEDGRVDDRLVTLRQLVVGEAGAAARAPGGDAVVLDQQVLVEDLLQRPPHGVHVLRVHRAVRVVQVDPVPHTRRELGEGVGVPGHGLTALGVELGDAERLDVLLAVEAQFFFHGEFDRQAVTVPAGLPAHVVALHGAEAGEDVLEDAGLDVVGAGHAVGGGRALVEDPLGAALGLVEALGEHLVLLPEVENGVLQRGQVDLGWYLAVLRRCHVRLPPADVFHFRRRDESVWRSRGTTLLGPGRVPVAPSLGSRCRV
ncbi:hypothetical protein SCYAM73S_07417 [Streptomyces cyaneofuscatus]